MLIPLLGVSNIPLLFEPEQPNAVYMLLSAILQHSQVRELCVCAHNRRRRLKGIFIAVLYCFLNGEVQTAVRRQLNKLPLPISRLASHRVRFETERTCVPPDGSITAATSTPTIGGRAQRRRPASTKSVGGGGGECSSLPLEQLNHSRRLRSVHRAASTSASTRTPLKNAASESFANSIVNNASASALVPLVIPESDRSTCSPPPSADCASSTSINTSNARRHRATPT